MKIAIDLDNTLADLKIVEDVSAEMNLNPSLKTSDVMSWGYKEFPQEVRDRIFLKLKDPNYMCNLKPYPWTINTLSRFAAKHELICITARQKEVSSETHIFVSKVFAIKQTIFLSKQENKLPALLKYKVDAYIDDNPLIMEEASRKGIRCYLLSNDDTKYNWNSRPIPGIIVIPAFDIQFLGNLCDGTEFNK